MTNFVKPHSLWYFAMAAKAKMDFGIKKWDTAVTNTENKEAVLELGNGF